MGCVEPEQARTLSTVADFPWSGFNPHAVLQRRASTALEKPDNAG